MVYLSPEITLVNHTNERCGTQTGRITDGAGFQIAPCLPATFNEHEGVILAAIETDGWQKAWRIAQPAPTKNRTGGVLTPP